MLGICQILCTCIPTAAKVAFNNRSPVTRLAFAHHKPCIHPPVVRRRTLPLGLCRLAGPLGCGLGGRLAAALLLRGGGGEVRGADVRRLWLGLVRGASKSSSDAMVSACCPGGKCGFQALQRPHLRLLQQPGLRLLARQQPVLHAPPAGVVRVGRAGVGSGLAASESNQKRDLPMHLHSTHTAGCKQSLLGNSDAQLPCTNCQQFTQLTWWPSRCPGAAASGWCRSGAAGRSASDAQQQIRLEKLNGVHRRIS